MIKASLVVSSPYQQNRIFDMNNPVNGRDNHLYLFFELKRQFQNIQIDIATQDINNINESQIVIFNDIPVRYPKQIKNQKRYLIALESIAVMPDNFDISGYEYFDKIFTWNDDLVDNKKIFKINYSFLIEPLPFLDFKDKKKFLCLVSNNKFSSHQNELYSERIKVIEYLEPLSEYQFDLYGGGWDKAYKNESVYNWFKYIYANKYLKKISIIGDQLISILKLSFILKKSYKNYLGPVSPKIPVLQQYKFNICYENIHGVKGYITEKIFDCFLAGCVPVYWGASNITDYIPADAFIDRRDFSDNKSLLLFLSSIDETQYQRYQTAIANFITSEKIKPFVAKYTAEKIIHEIQS